MWPYTFVCLRVSRRGWLNGPKTIIIMNMISNIEGRVNLRGDRFLTINTAGGVGYKVFVIPEVLNSSKKEGVVSLWTRLIVRDDSMELYGFKQYPELQFFETLIQISGVGPKSAMGILSIAPLDTIKKAIASGEVSYLTKVSGIGKKTAERVIVELRDKLGAMSETGNAMFKEDQDVLSALQSLGYSAGEAREALKNIPDSINGVNNRIKEALKMLGK